MKKLLIAIITTIVTISCGFNNNQYVVTSDGDSLSTNYLIGERQVGHIIRWMGVRRLNNIYGENYVKQLKAPQMESRVDSSKVGTYYIYSKENELLLIAHSEESAGGNQEVHSLIIKDDRFTTAKGITIKSNVDELRKAYPDAMVVQDDNRCFVVVSSLDLYCRIDPSNIAGYDPDFLADIPLDSLRGSARFENMSVSWNNSSTNIFSSQFWHDILTRLIKWMIFELPVLLFIVVVFVVLKRIVNYTVTRINIVVRRRVEADKTLDASEAIKRVDTITGILHGVFNIILWSIFVLTILSKFNINIAPILASAGILGLAVGFGAQELVRDFICGFFILLEDQIRTGDMAIINGTTGIVERIEMRTVTLRDPSGVVHIFQNGKINSLSNMTKEWSAIILEIGVAYKENVDRVIKIMQEVGADLRKGPLGSLMLDDVEIWGLDAFTDSAVVIKMVIRTRPMQQWRIKREYQRLLKIRFDSEGIEIPFPHLTIYTGDQTKPMPVILERED